MAKKISRYFSAGLAGLVVNVRPDKNINEVFSVPLSADSDDLSIRIWRGAYIKPDGIAGADDMRHVLRALNNIDAVADALTHCLIFINKTIPGSEAAIAEGREALKNYRGV